MNHSTRRDFLKHSALLGAAVAGAEVLSAGTLFGQDANSRPKLAAIGVGSSRSAYRQGRAIALRAAGFGDMVAVCDVDDLACAEFNDELNKQRPADASKLPLKKYRDYRKLLEEVKPDAVTIGTPDHWHVAIAIAALQAGCDVYCEKPLTLTIDEGIRICRAVKETGRVFQVGTQQRSEHGLLFLKAIAIVQSGRLGKDVKAYAAIGGAPEGGPFATERPPRDFDWNMWLGPAPRANYCNERRKEFRWYFEYSGGKMTDWGAHHIDIAQWALGVDHTGPVSVNAQGKFPAVVPKNFQWESFLEGKTKLSNAYNTAMNFNIQLKYANGAEITVCDDYNRDDKIKFPNGILFEGSEGRIYVNREKLTGKPVEGMTDDDRKALDEAVVKLYGGRQPGNHMGNFFECIAKGGTPISDVETHHRTMTSCHLCNIGLMLGRELKWNPDAQRFVDDPEADAFIARASRPGFKL